MATSTPKTEDAAIAKAAKAWQELIGRATAEDSPASRQINRAVKLEREISVLRKSVSDNREYLRLMDRNDELSEDQSEFLDTFYPEKERGERRSADEVEATRKAREAARKGNGGS